jgi:glycosyltransferase involved in cell wall biosynthesis
MARKSDRGLVRHLAYLVEACLVRELTIRQAVVHVHVHFGTNAAAVARLAHVLGGPRWSMTVHGPDEFDAPIGLALGEKVQDAAFTAAISHFCVAQLQRWTPPELWGRIALVRCSVGDDFEGAGPAPPPETSRFVCVGRLSAQKGQLLLLDALARLVAEGCDARLVLAGDGELRPLLEERVARLGLRERVEITGWISSERVRELLRESRALVLPSFAEGLPVAILEAFALARPVIATHVGGIPELVEPGRSGWLVPAGSLEALAAAMREALGLSGEALAEMGRAGRERVLEQHGTRAAVDALEAGLRAASCPDAIGPAAS